MHRAGKGQLFNLFSLSIYVTNKTVTDNKNVTKW